MSRVEGRGPVGEKWARFFNNKIEGPLGRKFQPGNGIEVRPAGDLLTISTVATVIQYFYLPVIDDDDLDDNKHGRSFDFRVGRSVSAGRAAGGNDATWVVAPSTSSPLTEIHFMYTTGWFPRGRTIRCESSSGVWECIDSGVRRLSGQVSTIAGDDYTVTLSGTSVVHGEETEVIARNPYNFTLAEGDDVGINWHDGDQCFDITEKPCL